jgi:hypothetical protein
MAGIFKQLLPKWWEERAMIMSAAQKQRVAVSKSNLTGAQSNLATAELNAARMRAQATANAYEETRVYNSKTGSYMYSSTPGNF